ncbi:class I SAM-dependent methyltransferase [Mariprofundus sp. NF]|uniref:class I SAM-dependent methyltransferase n=1 Tax=Mariprofundus sp. NF TaxID=2608716 RepID=UPI001F50BE86|nr:class I SAM-dependent methyltransferase [Mariprofundus sp. NF]
MRSYQQAQDIVRGDLEMTVCADCGFVFNAAFDPGLLNYGDSYDNNQGCSSSFQSHLNALISLLIDKKGVRGKQVVEVGCGQGQFLQRLVQEGGNSGVGFDPSYAGPPSLLDGRMSFESRYYDESCTSVPADVVICRHVIEHVPDPVMLLKSVRAAIGERTSAKVYFETPCVEWILRNGVIWDFFYEHCSLFTAASLSSAFQMGGFRVDEVRHVFGGQYLWIEASPVASDVKLNGGETYALATGYAEHELTLLQDWKQRVLALATDGRVALWGAGAKGVTFANLIDPDCELIDCLVDLNPNKQGKYVAGSGHAIVDPLQLKERGVSDVVLMNPNYRDENREILKQAGMSLNMIE